jgi:hypothetical protein
LPPTKGGLDLESFTPLIRSLGLSFLTADLAFRAERTWRVIELGDRQVSHRAASTEPAAFRSAVLTL